MSNIHVGRTFQVSRPFGGALVCCYNIINFSTKRRKVTFFPQPSIYLVHTVSLEHLNTLHLCYYTFDPGKAFIRTVMLKPGFHQWLQHKHTDKVNMLSKNLNIKPKVTLLSENEHQQAQALSLVLAFKSRPFSQWKMSCCAYVSVCACIAGQNQTWLFQDCSTSNIYWYLNYIYN